MGRVAQVTFGANIFGVGALADPGALADVARLAEDLGYHSVFVADHVVMPSRLASLRRLVTSLVRARFHATTRAADAAPHTSRFRRPLMSRSCP